MRSVGWLLDETMGRKRGPLEPLGGCERTRRTPALPTGLNVAVSQTDLTRRFVPPMAQEYPRKYLKEGIKGVNGLRFSR